MPKERLPNQLAILSLFPFTEMRTIKWEKKLMASQTEAEEWNIDQVPLFLYSISEWMRGSAEFYREHIMLIHLIRYIGD